MDDNNTLNDSKFFIIGDSLSDMGSFCKGATKWFQSHGFFWIKKVYFKNPYYQNYAFSNGPTAASLVATTLDKTNRPGYRFRNLFGKVYEEIGENYAFSGAHAGPIWSIIDPTRYFFNRFYLLKQVNALLKHHKIKPNDQIFCCIGANDLIWALKKLTRISETVVINMAINNQYKALKKLANNGAKHIVVANSPNLRITPLITKWSFLRQKSERIYQKYAQKWNLMMKRLIQEYPGIFKKYDLEAKVQTLILQFASLSSNHNTKQAALKINLLTLPFKGIFECSYRQNITIATLNNYFFLDFIHPTALVHEWLAADLIKLFQK